MVTPFWSGEDRSAQASSIKRNLFNNRWFEEEQQSLKQSGNIIATNPKEQAHSQDATLGMERVVSTHS